MFWYRTRIERDLVRWQARGWITETGAAAIRAELAERKPPVGAAGVLAILGAVLFGFAIMSFVAANWNEMSKLSRLILLVAVLWAFYAGAAWLLARQLTAFAHACVLGGIAVYGASIMLIAQMYHMEGNPPDAVLYWALGALLAAALLRSNAALAATFVLIGVWTGMERILNMTAHWAFLIPWAAAAAVAARHAWRPGLHLAALCLAGWLVPIGNYILDLHAHWVVAATGGVAAVVAVAAAAVIDRWLRVSHALLAYAVAVTYAALFTIQFIDDFFNGSPRLTVGEMSALAGLTLVGLVAAMYWAIKTDNSGLLWVAYVAFAGEIMALYVKMLGTLINTSLFFLSAAVVVTALAWLAYRLHHRQTPATGAHA